MRKMRNSPCHVIFLCVPVNGLDILGPSQNSTGCSGSKRILVLLLAVQHFHVRKRAKFVTVNELYALSENFFPRI